MLRLNNFGQFHAQKSPTPEITIIDKVNNQDQNNTTNNNDPDDIISKMMPRKNDKIKVDTNTEKFYK